MSVFQRVKDGVWWYEFRYRGVRIRESSKSDSKTVAQRIERERRRKMELGTHGLTKLVQPKTFSVACKAYLLEREANWEPKTRIMHANSFRHLEPHFGKLLLNEITAEHFSKYQRFRVKEGAAGRTVNSETNLLRLVLRKAKLWSNLVDDVQSLKENTDTGRELSDDEVKRLLAACEVSVSRALYPAVLTSIHTGLRGTELRLLRWKQVDLLNGIITVGKSAGESKTEGGKGRRVYLSAMAARTLQNWRAQFPNSKDEHFVFPSQAYALQGKKGTFGGVVVPHKTKPDKAIGSFATAWRTAKEAAGIECRWHDMRHSAASRIAAGGATDQTLQALLGWMSPKMVEKYSHVREEAKRKAVSVFDVAEPETDSPQNSPQTTTSEKQNII